MAGYGYNPWELALQQQQMQLAQQNGYMSQNGYGYGTPGSRGSAQGFQINPPQTQYAGDPSSMFGAMASVINNQNTNQANYDTAYGNAIWNRNNLLDQLRNQTQITGMNNETQRYGYDSALQGQLGVADRNLQGQLGVADRNMQTQLGTAGMALQGQLGAANIGANAQNYGNQLQAQTAMSGQQNAYNIANLQNQGGITQANIAANAQMLPANLRQQRFDSVLPIFDQLLGFNRSTPAAGGSPVATSPAPASPSPAPAQPLPGQTPLTGHGSDTQRMQLMNQLNANGRGNDPNLAGSQAWYARQAQETATNRARTAAAAPAMRQSMSQAYTPASGPGGYRAGAGMAGYDMGAANRNLQRQLSSDLSGLGGAQGGSPGAPQGGYQGRPQGGMPATGMATGGGGGNPTYTPDKTKAVVAGPGIGLGANTGGGSGNPVYKPPGGGMFGTSGTGPFAGGLPGGTGGPGAPGGESAGGMFGTSGTGPVAGGLPMGTGGPGAPGQDPGPPGGLPMGTGGPGIPGGGSPSASPFQSPPPSAAGSVPGSASLPAGSDLRSRMLADRAAAQAAAPAAPEAATGAPTPAGAAPGAPAPTPPGDAQSLSPPTGLAALLGGSSSSSGGSPVGTQPPITIAPPSTPQMWQQRVNAQVGSNAAQMAQQNEDLMRSSAARYGTNSRATQSMMQQNNARLMGLNQQARTQIPMQGMQQYSDYLLNAQRAQEEQYANRQREALQRQQISTGSIAPLLQALSSFSG